MVIGGRRKVLQGASISTGIVLGTARVVLPGEVQIAEISVPTSRISIETNALDLAIEKTVAEIRAMRDSATRKVGSPLAKIFDAQLLVASDYEFLKQVKDGIRQQRRNAAFVYNALVLQTTTPLKNSPDAYLQQMAHDIEAVSSKVLSHLSGRWKRLTKLPPQTILVSRTFSPGDILTYRELKAVGFLIAQGGTDSHMALISRSLMLPVVLTDNVYKMIYNGDRLIVDGTTGKVIVRPTDEDWAEYQKKKRGLGPTLIARISKLPTFPPKTADGKTVGIGANLTLPGPADDILARREIPVGLYRTEFLYLTHGSFPDEEEQYQSYGKMAEKFAPAEVVIRTFDLGYDKRLENNYWEHENNPALGWRGIRPMLEMTKVFKTQIRAILRASKQGNLKIMLPMITDLSEWERARRLIAQCKFRLRKEGVEFDSDIKVGIMIEVPSSAMLADVFASRVDFMSIGTNDLTQYTLAADRQNVRVAKLYNPFHPAVLKLVRMTVEACKRHKIPVSVCGELAGDPLAVALFIGMGVDLLSMSPGRIVDVYRLIRKIDSQLVRHLVSTVTAAPSAKAVTECLRDFSLALEKKNR